MAYFAEQTRKRGADAVAIIDRAGNVLARHGSAVDNIVARAKDPMWPGEGALLGSDALLFDVQRIPIGEENPVGYLLVGNLQSELSLHEDVRGLGIVAALVVDKTCISVLPPPYQRHSCEIDRADASLDPLRQHFHLKVSALHNAKLLVAVPLTQVRQFVGSFLPQIVMVFLFVLLAVGLVSTHIIERVMRPLEKLQLAADSIGQGLFPVGRAKIRPFLQRRDEIGSLAQTLDSAAKQLSQFVATCQSLTASLDGAVQAMDQSAALVASGADMQKQRLVQVRSAIAPMQAQLERAAAALSQLSGSNVAISSAITWFTHTTPKSLATATDGEHSGVAARAPKEAESTTNKSPDRRQHQEMHDAIETIRVRFGELRKSLEVLRDSTIAGQHHGLFIGTAAAEIERIAAVHADEAKTLRQSAELLRGSIAKLHKILSRIGK